MTVKAEEIKKLVRRVQLHRDRDAADQLIRFYYKDIYAFVYRQTGNMDLAWFSGYISHAWNLPYAYSAAFLMPKGL